MANNNDDNLVQQEEIEAESSAEAKVSGGSDFAEVSKEPSEEANAENAEESALEAEAVQEAADTDQVMPAEIAAINTDNDLAREASQVVEESIKEVKGNKMANEKFEKLIQEIEGLTTIELAELVKTLEEKFGVSAAAPMMAAPAAGAAAAPAEEEKSSYTLVLADAGAQKIAVIKALREINQELGLKEAKDLADAAPKEVKKDMPKADAEEAKKKLEAAGAKVELK